MNHTFLGDRSNILFIKIPLIFGVSCISSRFVLFEYKWFVMERKIHECSSESVISHIRLYQRYLQVVHLCWE